MSELFQLNISPAEQTYLKNLVHWSLLQFFLHNSLPDDKDIPAPDVQDSCLQQKLGAFVTLKKQGHLRGCIGYIQGIKPLYLTIAAMAQAAGFKDYRFPPLSKDELESIDIELSILSPLEPCSNPNAICIGRDGLLIHDLKTNAQGLLLPQVPVEHNWDIKTFLNKLCQKAGLPTNALTQGAKLYCFQAVVF